VSAAEDLMAWQLRAAGIEFVREYVYSPPRKFRADFAFPAARLLAEIQGGIFTGQAHGSVKGVLADIERLNAATLAGWRLLRFTPQAVKSGEALQLIERALS
jgi:very-short-patch-repair endonuclease